MEILAAVIALYSVYEFIDMFKWVTEWGIEGISIRWPISIIATFVLAVLVIRDNWETGRLQGIVEQAQATVRGIGASSEPSGPSTSHSLDKLRMRLASGEITAKQFAELKELLQ